MIGMLKTNVGFFNLFFYPVNFLFLLPYLSFPSRYSLSCKPAKQEHCNVYDSELNSFF